MSNNRFSGKSMVVLFSAVMMAFLVGCATTPAPPPPQVSYDGLQLVPNSKADIAYVDPDVDFATYKRIMLMPVEVSFDKRWKRDYDSRSVSMVPSSEWKSLSCL